MKKYFILFLSILTMSISSWAAAKSQTVAKKATRSLASERSVDMQSGAYAQINGNIANYFIEDYMADSAYENEDCGAGKYYGKCWKKTMVVEVQCAQVKSGDHLCELKPSQKKQ